MAASFGKRISRVSEQFVVFARVPEIDTFHHMVRKPTAVDGFREATVVDHLDPAQGEEFFKLGLEDDWHRGAIAKALGDAGR